MGAAVDMQETEGRPYSGCSKGETREGAEALPYGSVSAEENSFF